MEVHSEQRKKQPKKKTHNFKFHWEYSSDDIIDENY